MDRGLELVTRMVIHWECHLVGLKAKMKENQLVSPMEHLLDRRTETGTASETASAMAQTIHQKKRRLELALRHAATRSVATSQ